MSEAVLISIRPKWCQLIANSENDDSCGNEALRLHRAPQSWQYVEELSW